MTTNVAVTQAPHAVDKQNPWPGLAAFEEADYDFFKGRDDEIEALLRLILREDLTLFSGVSGLGKTSLLRAGLFPRLREADIFPVYVRARYNAAPAVDSSGGQRAVALTLAEQCFDAIRLAADRWGYEVPSEAPSKTTWEYMRRRSQRFWGPGDRLVTPLLVFDQFEELFTRDRDQSIPPEAIEGFFRDVSQTLSGSPPAWLLATPSEATNVEYLYRPGVFKVLLSFREDFFVHVAGLRTLVSAVVQNHFRLGPMTFGQALKVVDEAGGHLLDDRSVDAKKTICDRIVTSVAAAPSPAARIAATIDPALLSLFCRELNEKRQSKQMPIIDLELVESAEASRIIGDFYDSCMRKVNDATRRFVEERLVLRESRTRESLAEEAAGAAHVDPADIEFLIEKRILHRDETTRRGQRRLELTHDVLVGPALESSERRRIEDQQLREARERQEREASQRAEEQRQQQARDLAAAQERLALLEALNVERGRAEHEAQARREAEHQREIADQERQKREFELKTNRAEARTRRRNETIAWLFAGLAAALLIVLFLWQRSRENNRQLLSTRLERAIDDAATERPAQALARLNQVMKSDPRNVAAQSVALDLLLRQVWLLPVASIEPGDRQQALQINSRGDVITTTAAGTVRLWDVNGGRTIGSVEHQPGVASIRFSDDDRWFVTVGTDGTAILWDATARTLSARLPHQAPVTAVAFAHAALTDAGGPLLATAAADGTVQLWAMQGATLLPSVQLRHAAGVDDLEFSSDGARLLTASAGAATTWDSKTGRRLRQIAPASRVTVAHFTRDGGTIVTGSEDGGLRLWNAATGRLLAEGQCGGAVHGVAFDGAGTRLLTIAARPLSSTEPTAAIWKISTGSGVIPTGGATLDRVSIIRSADPDADGFFADDRTVVMLTAPDALSHSGRVRLSDASSGQPVAAALPIHAMSIRLSRAGRRVLVAGDNGEISVWTLRTPVANIDLRGAGPMLQARFSADGNRVLTASLDGTATVWDFRASTIISSLAHSGPVVSAEYIENGKVILTNTGRMVQAWNAETGRPAGEAIVGESGEFISARPNASGMAVVTASPDTPARVWDSSTGRVIREFPGAARLWSAEFNPAGDRIVSASRDGHADVWDVKTGAAIGHPLRHADAVVAARFSRDGSRIVTGSSDGVAKVWSVGSDAPLAEVKHLAGVSSVQFGQDNDQVITTSIDWTARIWTLRGGAADVLVLPHDAPVDSAQLDTSRRRLLTVSSRAGSVRVWDVETGRPLTRTIVLPSAVWFAEFSPDGQRIVAACDDGIARVVLVPSGDAADGQEWLQSLAEAVGGYRIEESGAIVEATDRGKRLEAFRAEAARPPTAGAAFRPRFLRWFFLDSARDF